MAELWRQEGLPEGVFQVLAGDGDAGRGAGRGGADMIFFTGSQKVGRQVAARCGERLIPCVVELGGKSPFIVLADADLAAAAHAAVWGSFANSGQVCIRPERVLVAAAGGRGVRRAVPDGDGPAAPGTRTPVRPTRPAADVGAMTTPAQVEHVEQQVQAAMAAGARLVAGGKRRHGSARALLRAHAAGRTSARHGVAREETFGPVLAVIAVRDEERGGADHERAGAGAVGQRLVARCRSGARVARRLNTGSVCVNDVLVNYFCVEAPLGGVKGSGLGFRHGAEALRQFCWAETIVEDAPGAGGVERVSSSGSWRSRIRRGCLRLLRWMMRRLY